MRRKTAPKVLGGRVQKKNRWATSPSDYYETEQPAIVIDRRRPGEGYRHLLGRRDVERFISILPQWDELSRGLNAVVLDEGGDDLGSHLPGVVHICAWERDLWWDWADESFLDEHRDLLERLGVESQKGRDSLVIKWTEPQARAFQLLHVFLHELGHHHDQMTTKSQRDAARGEPYAEAYAREHEQLIWERYLDVFGLD